MRYFLELSYNGKAYHGWQFQPNAISIQEVLENSLSKLLKTDISIVGAGRTDTGVHATQMFAHFDHSEQLDANLIYKLNSFLPKDIAVQCILEVTDDAHARFDAKSRTYIYKVSQKKDVFGFDYSYALGQNLDICKMNEACEILFQYNDFQCFSKAHTDVKTYHCIIMEAKWKMVNEQLHFTIKADRFLRNMVRAIVGTMIYIGTGKLKVDDLHDIIKSKDRANAGYSVPARGLYLVKIEYPKHIIRAKIL